MTEITLHYKRSDFEELYFRGGYEKILFAPSVKNLSYTFITLSVIVAGVLIFSLTNISFFALFILLFTIWSLLCVELGKRIRHILKWRKSINDSLDSIEKHKTFKIILSESSFTFIQDDEEFITRWTEFKSIKINNDYICLNGEHIFTIPAKSMAPDEYEILKAESRKKTGNS